MRKVVYKFAASAAVVMCAAGSAPAMVEAQAQELKEQASHNRFDDFDRWKQLVVLAAFVDVEDQTVTLRGLNFGKKAPTVFCETERMKVLKSSDTEVVVRFPNAVDDGSYLFTVARGNLDLERGAFYVAKVTSVAGGGSAERGAPGPEGPQGPAGPQGATGPQGPAGPAGATGPAGPAGAAGAAGPAGAAGAVGPTGPMGPQGVPGTSGAPGLPGAQGPAGLAGPAGASGGLSGYEQVSAESAVVAMPATSTTPSALLLTAGVACPAGKVPISGGWEPMNPNAAAIPGAMRVTPVHSSPATFPSGEAGWMVTMRNNAVAALTVQFRVWAVCAGQSQ